MATSLDKLENKVQIHHLHIKRFHMVKRLQNWLPWQRPLRYWKKNSDLSSTPKTLSYCVKIAKIAHGLCFAYDTKLVARQRPRNLKNWTWSRKFMQMPSIWWKDHENRSSRYWDSFAPSKKNIKNKEEINASKIYIARSAGLPSGLNKPSKIWHWRTE